MNQTLQQEISREYRLAQGWRIFICLLVVPMFALGIFMCLLPFFDETMDPSSAYFFVPLGLGFSLFMLYSLLETIYGNIIINSSGIRQVSVFGDKVLSISDIKGYEVDNIYIRIYPLEKQKSTIKISVTGINSDEILQWLNARKDNLEETALQQEIEELLTDHELGTTELERRDLAATCHKIAFWLNGVGYGIAAWLFIYPIFYKAAIVTGALYPVLLAGVMFKYKGVFRLNTKKKSAYPTLTPGILVAGMVVAVRALLDVELLTFSPILPWSLGVALVFFLLLISSTTEFKFNKAKDFGIASLIFLLLVFYGYGTSVMANVLLDNSAPVNYQAQVTDKHISNGKTTTYYLTLEPWGPRTEPEDISVTSEFYEAVPAGAAIQVQLYQGALNAPWLVVE